jgi:hypothetical protein
LYEIRKRSRVGNFQLRFRDQRFKEISEIQKDLRVPLGLKDIEYLDVSSVSPEGEIATANQQKISIRTG